MNQIEHIESFGSEDAENDQNLIDLFEFGIIGFYKPGGGGYGGSEYCYQFRSEMKTFLVF